MKTKLYYLITLAFLTTNLIAGNLFKEMADVNSRWTYEKDIPDFVYQQSVEFSSDEEKIRYHLKLVHQILSERPTLGLTEQQKKNRAENLGNLMYYYQNVSLPKNTVVCGRIPVFIDQFDNFCAVGYLIKASGHEDLSRKISRNMNYEFLLNMKDDELFDWVNECGLTAHELAWIQPAYYKPVNWEKMKEGTSGEVTSIADLGHMGILVGGQFDSAGIGKVDNLSVWQNGFSGFDWMPFSQNGVNGKVTDIEYYNGDIYVAGYFTFADTVFTGSGVIKWDGAQWEPLGEFYIGALVNTVYDLEIHNDTLYAGGMFRSRINAPSLFQNLAKWNGTEWVSAGGSPQGVVNVMKSAGDSLIIGGTFTGIGSKTMPRIAYLKNGQFNAIGQGLEAEVFSVEVHNNTLYAGGRFLGAANDTFGLAAFNGGSWQKLFPSYVYQYNDYNNTVKTIESTPYGLFIGGYYSYDAMFNIGQNLLRYEDGAGFSSMGALDSVVNDLYYSNNKLYVGGYFSEDVSTFGQPRLNNIVNVDIANMFSIDGQPEKQKVSIYPNPSSGDFTVELPAKAQVNRVELIDLSGKTIPLDYTKNSGNLEVNARAATGQFILNVETSEGVIREKIVLNKP